MPDKRMTDKRIPDKLALHGGPKVRHKPLVPLEHLRSRFGPEEKQALSEVIDSGHLCRVFGNRTREFEREICQYFGCAGALATTSGTAAIHCALAALGVGPGDEVVTSPLTDMGSVIPIIAQNAVPVFADVDPLTYNMTADSIEKVVTNRTKAVVVVHFSGQSCVMGPILDLTAKHGIHVVEDCAQSYLSSCDGISSGMAGDLGCFSLNDFKHITCGDGGFVLSDNDEYISRARFLPTRGIPRDGPVRNSLMFGLNYRITELQAAVAGVQLGKLSSIVKRRRTFAATLTSLLSEIDGINTPHISEGVAHSFWLYLITIDSGKLGVDPDTFAREASAEGIPLTSYLSMPVYLFDSIKNIDICGKPFSYKEGLCPMAEESLSRMLVLPCNEFMTESDATDIATAFSKICEYHLRG